MKWFFTILGLLCLQTTAHSWGFFGHQRINYYAVFLLPPEMMVLYKPHIQFLEEHAVDPDKRRYAVEEEGPRHYIDLDHYGPAPYVSLPRSWKEAVDACGEDSLNKYGIVPWWVQTMLYRLTEAFRKKELLAILKLSAEIGHYVSDAHVPLHACSNHNGQQTGQRGIHGFWESRIPEILAEENWDFLVGKAKWIPDPGAFIWKTVLQSAASADTVLRIEKKLSQSYPSDQRFAFEDRKGVLTRQYSTGYSLAYDKALKGMVERRMRESIHAVASFWLTAWINAGQPPLHELARAPLSPQEITQMEALNQAWKNNLIKGREHE
ncbi:MAG: zinc dependent phospholipase C family protein [Chitinophagaceae bacterium]